MKFDPANWNEAKPNEKTIAEKGWLRVRASAPAALYIQVDGSETLVSYGSTWDIQIGQEVTFHVQTETKGLRVFHESPRTHICEPDGETFANLDKMPHETGNLLEVRKAMRTLELAKRDMLRDIEQARASNLHRERKAPEPVLIEPAAAVAE